MEATREKIIDAALALFLDASYQKVSVNAIAARAGVSKGAVFHYFESKLDLAEQALFHFMDTFWSGFMQEVGAIGEPSGQLRQVIGRSLDLILEQPNLMTFFIEVYKEVVESGKSIEHWITFFLTFSSSLAALFAACGIPNPDLKAQLLIGCLDALGMEVQMAHAHLSDFDLDAFKREIYELFVGNYCHGPTCHENGGRSS